MPSLRQKQKPDQGPELITRRRLYRRIIAIPDTQQKPGVPTRYLRAIGNYIAEKEPDVIAHLGDHWDMPSLSSYENKNTAYWDAPDRTYKHDIWTANAAMDELLEPILAKKARSKWDPDMHFFLGNHENRVERAVWADPALKGTLDLDQLNLHHWKVHPFLKVVELDGILFSHYFVNQKSLKKNVLSGTIDNRLNCIKQSFVMGHQQGRLWGSQWTPEGREIIGLVAGSCYEHDEDYMPAFQGNHYWRGIVVLNEVRDGQYDPCFVSLNFLKRRYL